MSGWSDLPNDLVEMLLEHVTDFMDYSRIRCVCRAWREASQVFDDRRRRLCMPFLPCILMQEQHQDHADRRLSTPFTGGLPYKLRMDESTSKWRLFGSSCGWLAFVDKKASVRLHNPLTSEQVELPSVTMLPGISKHVNTGKVGRKKRDLFSCEGTAGRVLYTKSQLGMCYPDNLRLSSPKPMVDPDCIVMVSMGYEEDERLAYCRTGDKTWTKIYNMYDPMYQPRMFPCSFGDFTYYKGMFIQVDQLGQVMAFNLCNPPSSKAMQSIKPTSFLSYYNSKLAILPSSDELLQIFWKTVGFEHYKSLHAEILQIYKITINGQNGSLEKEEVASIGDYSLFLDKKQVAALPSSVLSPVCRANCIYFIGDCCSYVHCYNIEDRTTIQCQKDISATCNSLVTWVVPHL